MKPATLEVRTATGEIRQVPLERGMVIGRDGICDLSFPEDGGLSRQHLTIEYVSDKWMVRDLGSRNGTFLNGQRIDAPQPVRSGDTIRASKTQLILRLPASAQSGVIFNPEHPDASAMRSTVVISLKDIIEKPDEEPPVQKGISVERSSSVVRKNWSSPVQALLRAGRELVAGRPLPDLFRVILDLSIEAVGAERGVLMTLENGVLVEQASSEGEFHISSTVRDKVINDKASMLIHDAMGDAMLQHRQSIVLQNVLSLIAVPLQTEDRVIGLIYVDSRSMQRMFTPEHLNLLTVMANVAAIRIERARLALLEQAEERHRMEMEQAALIQQRSLPSKPPKVPGFLIDGRSIPCHTVGGDYFDYLTLADGRALVMVADVAGKGMPAALLVMSLQANAHALAPTCSDLTAFVTRLNQAVVPRCPSNRFITFFACAIDTATGKFEFANAGHNPPMLFRTSGAKEVLPGGGPPLGIAARAKYAVGRSELGIGDHLLLYTDGITEAETREEQQYEEERLEKVVLDLAGTEPAALIDGILQSVETFVNGAPASDDRTLVSILRR